MPKMSEQCLDYKILPARAEIQTALHHLLQVAMQLRDRWTDAEEQLLQASFVIYCY